MIFHRYSFARFAAIARKEFVQMRRDRLTFAMIVGIPILQLVLFGYAINTDPKSLPTAVVDHDRSIFSRSLVQAITNTGYFRVGRFIKEYPQHQGPMTDILIGRIFHPTAGDIFKDLDPWIERMQAEGATS
jgi:ABC-2 type transport system permease protein